MPVFAYTAIDTAEGIQQGVLTADSPAEGRQRLREVGLCILEFKTARSSSARRFVIRWSSRRRSEQVAELARHLALLLRAGVPVVQSLAILARQRRGDTVTVLKDLADQINGGSTLADALAAHPRWFDTLFVSAARVGEATGNLDDALTELARHLEASRQLRGQLTTALTYPVILACVGAGVVLFLMTYVIPQLLTVLAASGQSLPASTVFLKAISDGVREHGLGFGVLAATIIAATAATMRMRSGRRWGEMVVLRLPLLGALVRRTLVAQFAQRMAILLHTGVPFVDAARTVQSLSRWILLQDELNAMIASVESGRAIAATMTESRVFPPVVAHLVAVGQDTGELPRMLNELQESYESEVRLAMTRFTAALEPLLIVVLAAAIGFVVYACLMPILQATRGIAGGV